MKFEEVLPKIRNGERARVKNNENIEYWAFGIWSACKTGLFNSQDEDRFLSLVCVNEDGTSAGESDGWGIPVSMIMRDDWEIVE